MMYSCNTEAADPTGRPSKTPGAARARNPHQSAAATVILAVATSAYAAAVFLSADAVRRKDPDLERQFRLRALGAGLVAGAAGAAGLVALSFDTHHLLIRLVEGRGLTALTLSISAGIATLALLWLKRYDPARFTAALAVGAIILGWALAQAPVFLKGLTIKQAAAPQDTLVAVSVAVIAGGIILFPSLAVLFRLALAGQFDETSDPTPRPPTRRAPAERASIRLSLSPSAGRLAVTCLIGGIGFTTVASTPWAHAIGVVLLFGFAILGFRSALPPNLFDPD